MSEPQARLTDVLKNYWDEKKGSNPYPAESDINSDDLKDIWENCFLAEVKGNNKFRYSYLGESIIEAYGDNLEGEEVVEDLLYPESPGVVAKFSEVLEAKEPLYFDGAFINKNNMDIKFRKILLPLGKDGKITYIIGGMRWKAF